MQLRQWIAASVFFVCSHGQAIELSTPRQPLTVASPITAVNALGDLRSIRSVDIADETLVAVSVPGLGDELFRLLADGQLELLADICPGPCSSNPSHLSVVGDAILFGADDGLHGRRLWRSDGTPEGTRRIPQGLWPGKVVVPDTFILLIDVTRSLRPYEVFDNHLFFRGQDVSGRTTQLWTSDGTEQGTSALTGINTTIVGDAPQQMRAASDALYLVTSTGDLYSPVRELVRATTTNAEVIDTGTEQFPQSLHGASSNHLFFSISPSEGPGSQLRALDLVTNTQQQLLNLTDLGLSLITGLVTNNGYYFSLRDSELSETLWFSDGTPENTVSFTSLLPDISPAPSRIIGISGGQPVLIQQQGENSRLLRFNGTDASPLADLPNANSYTILRQREDDLTLLLSTDDGYVAALISPQGNRIKSLSENTATSLKIDELIGDLQRSRRQLYNHATTQNGVVTSEGLRELIFDGRDRRVRLDWQAGLEPEFTARHADALIFSAENKLWRATERKVVRLNKWLQQPLPDDASLRPVGRTAMAMLLQGNSGLWALPDASRTPTLVTASTETRVLHDEAGITYVISRISADQLSLQRLTATARTEQIATLSVPEDMEVQPFAIAATNSGWLLTAYGDHTTLLYWQLSQGDIDKAPLSDALASNPLSRKLPAGQRGDSLLFVSTNELWSSDGSVENTGVLMTLPSSACCLIRSTLKALDAFWFVQEDIGDGWKVWRSDGSVDGTVVHASVSPHFTSGRPALLAGSDTVLYFSAADQTHPVALWRVGEDLQYVIVTTDDGKPLLAPSPMSAYQDGWVFTARAGTDSPDLWIIDAAGNVQRLAGELEDIGRAPMYVGALNSSIMITSSNNSGRALRRIGPPTGKGSSSGGSACITLLLAFGILSRRRIFS
jgi:ELWxxDGT repeat protein